MIFHVIYALSYEDQTMDFVETFQEIGFITFILINSKYPDTFCYKSSASKARMLPENAMSGSA